MWNYTYEGSMLRYLQSWIDQLRWQRLTPTEKLAECSLLAHLEGILKPLFGPRFRWEYLKPVNGNIKALLRRGYRDINYLLLKAQRPAAAKTEFLVLQKAS